MTSSGPGPVLVGLLLFSLMLSGPSAATASGDISAAKLKELWPLWRGNRTTEQVLARYADIAEERLKPYFDKAGVPYPPKRISLVSLKEEKLMELWAWHGKRWKHIHDYRILGASGHGGPKLRQGDKQVPEGAYRILYLNPNSRYHLSMKLNYPNKLDRRHARAEKRTKLGGDIFIHGTEYSIGCLALGNKSIQELYVLAAKTGVKNIEVIIAPYDFRRHKPIKRHTDPSWVNGLYADLKKRLSKFPRKGGKPGSGKAHPADALSVLGK